MNLYLDHNVYIECLEDDDLINFLIDSRDKKQISIFYGPAHIEEIYRAETLDESYHASKGIKLMKIIDKITNSRDLMPSLNSIVEKNENTRTVYKRVKGMDTTNFVENNSLIRFNIDTKNYKKMVEDDKHNSSISNLTPEKIWEHPLINEKINELNQDIDNIITSYNNSQEVALLLFCGIDKRLPFDFRFAGNNYKDRLKNSFTELEYTIEILMRVLNFCGYYAEKDENKAISSTHDTTHCIYASAADHLISMDKRFSMKTKAIYKFLGIDTQVTYCQNVEEVKSAVSRL